MNILRDIWPEVNFKDYLNLKDYLTSITLKIISPQANSYKSPKVLRPQQLVGHRSWNMKFWIFCQFFPAFEGPVFHMNQSNQTRSFICQEFWNCLVHSKELLLLRFRILVSAEIFFVEVFPSVSMALPLLMTKLDTLCNDHWQIAERESALIQLPDYHTHQKKVWSVNSSSWVSVAGWLNNSLAIFCFDKPVIDKAMQLPIW